MDDDVNIHGRTDRLTEQLQASTFHHCTNITLTRLLSTRASPSSPSDTETDTAKMLRPTLRLLATPSTIGSQSSGLKRVPPALLPPILLYRRILRGHRKFLPQEMRVLGDEYVKAEFRAHQKIDNPIHIVAFLSEWQSYAQQVEGENWRGEKMDRGKIDKMSGEWILFSSLSLSLSLLVMARRGVVVMVEVGVELTTVADAWLAQLPIYIVWESGKNAY